MIHASGRAMLNAGCIFAVAFWICVLLRSQQQPTPPLRSRPHLWLAAIAAIAISLAAFQSTLWNPFQFDAFTHLFEVRDAALPAILARFGRNSGENLFFRPVGWLAYWIDAHSSGADLLRWHLVNVVLHALNGLLVYLLLLRLDLQRLPAAFGAFAFLTSGVAAEPVAWIDAPFDLLASFFLLLAILELLRWTRSACRVHWAACCALVAVACCTKESAFCAPLLIGAIAVSRSGAERKRAWLAAGSVATCCSAVFVYRWWALRGIGGYRLSAASDLLHVTQLLLLRMWGVLLFPINWSQRFPTVILFVYIAALIYEAVRSRACRSALLCGLAWSVAAVLPVLPIALLSADLSGSRVYYLASIGFTIALASILAGLRPGYPQIAVARVAIEAGRSLLSLKWLSAMCCVLLRSVSRPHR